MSDQGWGAWFRANADKFLLLSAFIGIMGFVLHVSHDVNDASLTAWGRELGSGAFAAFLTMVTGSLIRGAGTTANLPPGSTATTQIQTVTPPVVPPIPIAPPPVPPVAPIPPATPIKP